ncbi:MAG: GNAT family N-acetyltransferase [Candidatus Methanomethylophilaceae archaeon]
MPVSKEIDDLASRVSYLAHIIWKECYEDILPDGQIDYMLNVGQTKDIIIRQIVEEGYEYSIIKDNNKDIGYYGYSREGDTLFLSKIYVLKEARGRGFGTMALNDVYLYAEKHRLKMIRLRVNRNNVNAIRAYEANGYSIYDEDKSDIGNGFFMDDYLMKKDILQMW